MKLFAIIFAAVLAAGALLIGYQRVEKKAQNEHDRNVVSALEIASDYVRENNALIRRIEIEPTADATASLAACLQKMRAEVPRLKLLAESSRTSAEYASKLRSYAYDFESE